MENLINISNVTKVAESLKIVGPSLSLIQKNKQHRAKPLINCFKKALQEFKNPTPVKLSLIDQFDIHLSILIASSQALFNILDENTKYTILCNIEHDIIK
jgi:hypothetical protein